MTLPLAPNTMPLRDWVPMPASLLVPDVAYGSGPEAVYIIECWSPGAYYVGVSSQVEKRLRRHWDDQFVDLRVPLPFQANAHFMTTFGYKHTLAIIRVADRATAERLECDWTYEMLEHGRIVFGRGITANCPSTTWLGGFGGVQWWDRNTVERRAPTI